MLEAKSRQQCLYPFPIFLLTGLCQNHLPRVDFLPSRRLLAPLLVVCEL